MSTHSIVYHVGATTIYVFTIIGAATIGYLCTRALTR